MAMVKLNTFHWHITDSQSFPLVLKSHPELSQIGAYSSDKVYTADDIKEVINVPGNQYKISYADVNSRFWTTLK